MINIHGLVLQIYLIDCNWKDEAFSIISQLINSEMQRETDQAKSQAESSNLNNEPFGFHG